MERSKLVRAVQLSVRAGLASLLSVLIARSFGLDARQALITSVLVIDLSPEDTRARALPRFAATVLGGVLGASLSMVTPGGGIAVGIGVTASVLASHLLRIEGAAARLAGFVCGVILLHEAHAPWTYALYRLAETTIGIAMATLTSFVPQLLPLDRKR
jgi:uncharacterized membrane protein YgaE (UPF0421/DUF939 family)